MTAVCGLCDEARVPIAGTDATFCPTCDRRECGDCGYPEQDPTASRCGSCKAEFE